MDIDEIEKRLIIMGKLADFNEKLRDDYQKSIDTILMGTQKVCDFFSTNTKESSTIVDTAVKVASTYLNTSPEITGVKMLKDFIAPIKPDLTDLIEPVIETKEPEIDNTDLLDINKALAEYRVYLSKLPLSAELKHDIIDQFYNLQMLAYDRLIKKIPQ